jgi:hypothetical protein
VLRPLARAELLALAAEGGALGRHVSIHLREDREARLPLDGADLGALGLAGPAVGRALAALRRAVLDGTLGSRAEALAWARRRAAREGRSAPA